MRYADVVGLQHMAWNRRGVGDEAVERLAASWLEYRALADELSVMACRYATPCRHAGRLPERGCQPCRARMLVES